ncbi:MAG TPA: hypothetical protein VMF55_05005 [Solirubrobacterales bacterium]|nr:hypothetical protein [Solirubrobacterales bacterium]
MRLLIVTDDPAAATNLHEPLEEIAGGEELEVKVVAPLRPESTLDLLTGDIDDAAAGARERAASTASQTADAEPVTTTEAGVGDADQLLAIGDALAEFEAERVVLVDADDEELAGAVRERYGLPVTELSAR